MSKLNDFSKPENRARSPYRAWIVWRPGSLEWDKSINNGYSGKGLLYAYNDKPPEIALQKLINYINRQIQLNQVHRATIYDNHNPKITIIRLK